MPLTDEELAAKIAKTGNAKDAFIAQDLKEALEELSDRAGSGGGGAVDSVNGESGVVVLTQDDIADGATYKQFSQTEKTKLSGVSSGATANASNAELRDRTTHTGSQAITTITGLQSALDSKAVPSDITTALSAFSEVDNTSDANKPISTDTQTALNNKADLVDGKVPAIQLPAYVDDIIEYADLASFPATGASGILYLALDTDIVYRWSGSTYIDIGASDLVLGETSVTAYRGDRGKTAYDHSQLTGNPHGATLDSFSDGTTNKGFTATEKTKLSGIASGATANSSDAALRGRSTHTGVQDISTITGLQTALDGKVATDGAKVLSDVNFSTALNSKLSGIATGATANSSDATLLARANHTGTQLAATISNFNSAALSAAPAETATTLGTITTGATAKTEAVDADSIGITDSAASNIWKKLSLLNLWYWVMRNIMSWFGWFNVKYYSATGDGATVDNTAFQNCFNAAILAHGKVIIPSPSNFYNITSTIQVYPNASSIGADNEVNVDVEATGTPRFLIKYSGTTGTACFDINGLRYSKWSGVSVLLADTTNLIAFDLDTKSAASSLSNNNFHSCNAILGNATGQTGWRIGETSANGGDFSSLAWYNCQVYGVNKSVTGTIGWHIKGSNALQNSWHTMFGANLDKMYSNSGGGNGGVTFVGAGTSQCNLDYEIANNQTYTWNGGRFESGERAIHVTNSNVSPSLVFVGAEWNDYTPSDGIGFYIDMPCSVTLLGCNVQTGPTESEYTANWFKLYGGGSGTGIGRLVVIGGSYECADPMYDHSGNDTDWEVRIIGVGRQNSSGVNTLMMGDSIPTNLNQLTVADGSIAQAKVANLTTDLAGKAALADISTAITTERTTTATLTNKTIALGSNTVSGTIAQFNTAVSDADLATIAGTETLTNKTLTSPTLTTPRIVSTGSINDANGNEYVRFNQTTSAVNEVTITNAATGTRPAISASGGDTNIDLNLVSKGTGVLRINNNVIPQSTTVFNVKEDVRPSYSQANAVANGSTNDQNALQYGMYASNDNRKIVYLPAGTYLVNSQIQLPYDAMEIRGAGIGKTTITIGASYSGTGALFNIGGKSDLTISDLTISGNSKRIDAAIQLGSFASASTQCRRINIERVRFYNLWTTNAIMFGGTSATPDTHSLGDITIRNCHFENIYDPALPVIYLEADSDALRCHAINLNQTTNKAVITGNFIKNCSGNGLYAFGQTQTTFNPDYGNWLIHGNHIESVFMGIEINGQALPKGIKIDNNIIKYSTNNGGYLISIDSYQAAITNNTLYGVDRSLIEFTSIGGLVANNTGTIVVYSATSGGVAPTVEVYSVAGIEAYGFANTIVNNNFILDRSSPGTYTAEQFNGIKIVYETTDPSTQPTSFDGITDLSGYWDIKGNTIHGFTHRAIDASNEKIRKVNIVGNTFLSRVCIEKPLAIYGYNWIVKGNIFDMTGSTPAGGEGAIGTFTGQDDNSVSIVQDNTIIHDAWKIVNTDKFVAFNNHLVNTTTNLAYQMYPYPPMTATEKAALTAVEGMAIYQTDGTVGPYVYKGGAWVAL